MSWTHIVAVPIEPCESLGDWGEYGADCRLHAVMALVDAGGRVVACDQASTSPLGEEPHYGCDEPDHLLGGLVGWMEESDDLGAAYHAIHYAHEEGCAVLVLRDGTECGCTTPDLLQDQAIQDMILAGQDAGRSR